MAPAYYIVRILNIYAPEPEILKIFSEYLKPSSTATTGSSSWSSRRLHQPALKSWWGNILECLDQYEKLAQDGIHDFGQIFI